MSCKSTPRADLHQALHMLAGMIDTPLSRLPSPNPNLPASVSGVFGHNDGPAANPFGRASALGHATAGILSRSRRAATFPAERRNAGSVRRDSLVIESRRSALSLARTT